MKCPECGKDIMTAEDKTAEFDHDTCAECANVRKPVDLQKLSTPQRNLISYNYAACSANALLAHWEEQAMLRMADDENMRADTNDLVSSVWDLANKRDSEWLPNEKEKRIESFRALLLSYCTKRGWGCSGCNRPGNYIGSFCSECHKRMADGYRDQEALDAAYPLEDRKSTV